MDEKIKEFYEKTKLDFSNPEEIRFDFEWPINWIKIYFKRYPRMSQIPLETTSSYTGSNIVDLIQKRVSHRRFKDGEIDFKLVSDLLYFSLGIKNPLEQNGRTRRMYPSAGARYPIEAYLISNNTKKIPKGLFHYNVKDNNLELLLEEDLKEESKRIFGAENYKGNPNYLVLTGVMSRTEAKYGVNAYRFAMMEAGHIGQNFSLISADKDLGCCAIGGFDNERLAKLLDLTEDEMPIYAFAFGKPDLEM